MTDLRPGNRLDTRLLLSQGIWYVATDLPAEQLDMAGLVVAVDGKVLADCRNGHLPDHVCRANARAIAAVPHMIEALKRAEDYFGDQPQSDKQAMVIYRAALAALQEAGVRRRGKL